MDIQQAVNALEHAWDEQAERIAELESKLDQVRSLLISIDEALSCNPRIERVVTLLNDSFRNPFAELMTCAQREGDRHE